MIRNGNGNEFFTFESEGFHSTVHGIFTRKGGVSPNPWKSMNLGGTVGDDPENVYKNHVLAFNAIGRKLDSKFDVWQVHSTQTVCTSSSRDNVTPHAKADAIFTNNPAVTLVMRFADCVPILLIDPELRIVGIIHAGWQGTVNQIVCKAIEEICKVYGANPKRIYAGIGPSIGPDHYFVGKDVHDIGSFCFKDVYNEIFTPTEDGKFSFNLWRANEYLLQKSGVTRIERADICTACNLQDWFSHRVEKGKTGRFGALIALKE